MHPHRLHLPLRLRPLLAIAGLGVLAGCSQWPSLPSLPSFPSQSTRPAAPALQETVWAVTSTAELVRFSASQPQKVLQRLPLKGLPAGEQLVGIDFRVARGVLYALTSGGQLCTLDTETGQLRPVGAPVAALKQPGRTGFDFNPVADRIRVVTETGLNLRLHPDTGAVAAVDPPLQWSGTARVAGAAYTYNQKNDKLTTNYAIDLASGSLLTQGSHESVQPAVSPNTGRLFSVGPLGTGAIEDAAFDISDVGNTALAALAKEGRTRLHHIDLASGRATLVGTIGSGQPLWGLAIAP